MSEPERVPQNKQRDVVERFRDEYGQVLVEAETSATHTATEGWHRLYVGQRKNERDRRRKLAESLKSLADRMESVGLCEEEEKELAQIKKGSSDLRDAIAAFEMQTIEPVRAPVEMCRKLVTEAREAARNEEERAPLVNVGLEEVMVEAITHIHKVSWDAELGRVIITDPQ